MTLRRDQHGTTCLRRAWHRKLSSDDGLLGRLAAASFSSRGSMTSNTMTAAGVRKQGRQVILLVLTPA